MSIHSCVCVCVCVCVCDTGMRDTRCESNAAWSPAAPCTHNKNTHNTHTQHTHTTQDTHHTYTHTHTHTLSLSLSHTLCIYTIHNVTHRDKEKERECVCVCSNRALPQWISILVSKSKSDQPRTSCASTHW